MYHHIAVQHPEILKDGTKELYDGSLDLNDGAKDLLDGMKELDKDGIQKLSDVLRDDMTRYADRMRGLLRIAKNYDSFTGSTEGMENSVKFILKTAEIYLLKLLFHHLFSLHLYIKKLFHQIK